MGAGGPARGACRDMADEGRSHDERQLRLVPAEQPQAVTPSAGEGHVYVEEDGRSGSVVTLAAYVLGLTVGSPCFCCGETLVPGEAGHAGGPWGGLVCPECEAEVEREAHS